MLVRFAYGRRLWPGVRHVRLPRFNVTLYLDFTSLCHYRIDRSNDDDNVNNIVRSSKSPGLPTVNHARGQANRCVRRSVAGRRPTGKRRAAGANEKSRQSRRRVHSTYRQVRFRKVFQRARSEHPVCRRVGRERHELRNVNEQQQFFAMPVHRDLQHDQTTKGLVVVVDIGFVVRPVRRASSNEQNYRIQRLRRV